MKFQKQLEAQLVAEWINAYVNYKQLKKDIKQIREQIASKEDHPVTNKHSASSFLKFVRRILLSLGSTEVFLTQAKLL
ncbi:hypothetical protein SUGI_0106740 [Cryptomeria japonica]|nr:hypothetical protein SUGI_0106740 [Cryptomeria japonica]